MPLLSQTVLRSCPKAELALAMRELTSSSMLTDLESVPHWLSGRWPSSRCWITRLRKDSCKDQRWLWERSHGLPVTLSLVEMDNGGVLEFLGDEFLLPHGLKEISELFYKDWSSCLEDFSRDKIKVWCLECRSSLLTLSRLIAFFPCGRRLGRMWILHFLRG